MAESHPLETAIIKIGLAKLARELEVTPPAMRKWQRAGRMPRTEWTGETDYAKRIERLCDGAPSAEQLLKPWPKWPADAQPLIDRRADDQAIDIPNRSVAAQGAA